MDSSWKRQVEARTRVLVIYFSLINAIDKNVSPCPMNLVMANGKLLANLRVPGIRFKI